MGFRSRWQHRQKCLFSSLHDYIKITTKVEQPSLRTMGNQVEWKSDNYGIKGTTQTGRRGTDAEWAGPTPACGG